jgi:hypothetical protein
MIDTEYRPRAVPAGVTAEKCLRPGRCCPNMPLRRIPYHKSSWGYAV